MDVFDQVMMFFNEEKALAYITFFAVLSLRGITYSGKYLEHQYKPDNFTIQ